MASMDDRVTDNDVAREVIYEFDDRISSLEDSPSTNPGGSGKPDAYSLHIQMVPSSVWIATHSLGKYPSVTVVDSSGMVVEGTVSYPSGELVRVDFTSAFSGEMHLN